MGAKTDFLQVRVTPEQKAALKRLATEAGQDVSTFVLTRALPAAKLRFGDLMEALRDEHTEKERRFLLAELNDLLTAVPASAFANTVAKAELRPQDPLTANYVAAMVEHAASRFGVSPPAWTRQIEALEIPYFATDLRSLRPWLLASSPVAFKKRNLFVDSSIGDRV
ncbi:MAG: DUF1778 domain-containing protein [Candidatus Binatia bacterium]